MGVVKHNQGSEWAGVAREGGVCREARVEPWGQIKNPNSSCLWAWVSRMEPPCSLFSQGGVGGIIWGEFSVGWTYCSGRWVTAGRQQRGWSRLKPSSVVVFFFPASPWLLPGFSQFCQFWETRPTKHLWLISVISPCIPASESEGWEWVSRRWSPPQISYAGSPLSWDD